MDQTYFENDADIDDLDDMDEDDDELNMTRNHAMDITANAMSLLNINQMNAQGANVKESEADIKRKIKGIMELIRKGVSFWMF